MLRLALLIALAPAAAVADTPQPYTIPPSTMPCQISIPGETAMPNGLIAADPVLKRMMVYIAPGGSVPQTMCVTALGNHPLAITYPAVSTAVSMPAIPIGAPAVPVTP